MSEPSYPTITELQWQEMCERLDAMDDNIQQESFWASDASLLGPQRGPVSVARIAAQSKAIMQELDSIDL